MTNYQAWIANWLDKNGGPNKDGYGKCKHAVKEMSCDFPELTIAKGHVYCPSPWNTRGHWWLKTEAGEIIDPTASQFPFILDYEESGFKVWRYKYIGRGMEIEGMCDWPEVLRECLGSIVEVH